ncbi:hypothetical protein ACOME3_003637 [Neoechinorhynchus agilis]
MAETDDNAMVSEIMKTVVSPGEILAPDRSEFMRGRGSYVDSDDVVRASMIGIVKRMNRLVQVDGISSHYSAEIGDVVIGRVSEVSRKKWRVDINGAMNAILPFTSVNLPGGELRRRFGDVAEERLMRNYLKEGDLLSAEIYNQNQDGSFTLHTRSMKYGKLGQGVLTTVPCHLIIRTKTHFVTLFTCEVDLILGLNGCVWVSPSSRRKMVAAEKSTEENVTGGYAQDMSAISTEQRMAVNRVSECVKLLAKNEMKIIDTTIMKAFDASLAYEINQIFHDESASKYIIDACVTRDDW